MSILDVATFVHCPLTYYDLSLPHDKPEGHLH